MSSDVEVAEFSRRLPKLQKPSRGLSVGDTVVSLIGEPTEAGGFLLAFATRNEESPTFLLTPYGLHRLRTLLEHFR
jgi:hypothetical protein